MRHLLRILAALVALAGTAHAGATTTASSGNVAASNAVATLPATPGMQWAVSGLEITAGGATAAGMVSATLSGVAGGTITYSFGVPAGAGVPAVPLVVRFEPPLDAAAPGTAVILTLPALAAGNLFAAVALHGYLR